MSKARTILPIDIVALVSFDGRVYPNEARPWGQLGAAQRGPHPLETALEQWFSFATGKQAWINVRGTAIRGLISARRRARRSAWEVEYLINADEDPGVCLNLFNQMTKGLAAAGAERIFLRLPGESPLAGLACRSGFFSYRQESLYRLDAYPELTPPPVRLRPRAKDDAFRLYQLYNESTPATIRVIEGMTFRDWQAAQEPWGGRPTELVLDGDSAPAAWVRYRKEEKLSRFSLDVSPSSEHCILGLLSHVLHRLADGRPVYCLVPGHAASLALGLKAQGFVLDSEYIMLARRLTIAAEDMAPEHARTTIVVS